MFGIDPAGHHMMNAAWHAIDVVALFWVLLLATGYLGRSFMVAALFAVHPINVESVAWMAERKTLLSTFFFLLALGAYRWYARQPGRPVCAIHGRRPAVRSGPDGEAADYYPALRAAVMGLLALATDEHSLARTRCLRSRHRSFPARVSSG